MKKSKKLARKIIKKSAFPIQVLTLLVAIAGIPIMIWTARNDAARHNLELRHAREALALAQTQFELERKEIELAHDPKFMIQTNYKSLKNGESRFVTQVMNRGYRFDESQVRIELLSFMRLQRTQDTLVFERLIPLHHAWDRRLDFNDSTTLSVFESFDLEDEFAARHVIDSILGEYSGNHDVFPYSVLYMASIEYQSPDKENKRTYFLHASDNSSERGEFYHEISAEQGLGYEKLWKKTNKLSVHGMSDVEFASLLLDRKI